MAARAVALSSLETRVALWDRFLCTAGNRVREGNTIAGEAFWNMERPPGPAPVLSIRSARRPDEFLECSIDFERGVLTCRPGPAVTAGPLQFHLSGETAVLLLSDGRRCTIDQAVTLILDGLVWMEDCEGK